MLTFSYSKYKTWVLHYRYEFMMYIALCVRTDNVSCFFCERSNLFNFSYCWFLSLWSSLDLIDLSLGSSILCLRYSLSGCNLQGHCLAWFTDQILFHSLQQLSSRLSGQRPAGAWHKSASPMSWQRRLVLSCPFSVSFVGTDDTFTRYAYSCCVVFRLWIRPRLLVSLFYFLCYFLPVSFMNEWNRLKALIKSSLFPTAWCC